jgi:hypothetical protein
VAARAFLLLRRLIGSREQNSLKLTSCTILKNRLSGLFHKKVHSLWNRHHSQEQAFRPVPQENSLFVEQAGKPVHKKLIENGATSQFKIDLTVNDKNLEETVWRYLCIAKESGAAIAKNSLLAVKNDA